MNLEFQGMKCAGLDSKALHSSSSSSSVPGVSSGEVWAICSVRRQCLKSWVTQVCELGGRVCVQGLWPPDRPPIA